MALCRRLNQHPPWLSGPRLQSSSARRPTSVVRAQAALHSTTGYSCPFQTLGVPSGADDKQIKQAYRRLALQYHPDVQKQVDDKVDAERRFLSIQRAYELLSGKSRSGVQSAPGRGHSGVGTAARGWDFHDWFWEFRYSREKARQSSDHDPEAAQAPPPQQPQQQQRPRQPDELRSQLAGLRHRAAVRSMRPAERADSPPPGGPPAAAGDASLSATAAEAEDAQEPAYDNSDLGDGVSAGGAEAPQGQAQRQARRQFVAHSGTREQVTGQLVGLKRKAAIKARC